jgi:hypothetical protein
MTTNNFSAASCSFIAKIWFLLSFSVPASKFPSLLITDKTSISRNTNRIQREFLFYEAILSHSLLAASSHQRQKNKPFQTKHLPFLSFLTLLTLTLPETVSLFY